MEAVAAAREGDPRRRGRLASDVILQADHAPVSDLRLALDEHVIGDGLLHVIRRRVEEPNKTVQEFGKPD